MSTRYVWKRFATSTLKQNLKWGSELSGGGSGFGVSDTENTTVTACSSYNIRIDSNGKVRYIPAGNMYTFAYNNPQWISSSTYSYCIVSYSNRDEIMRPASRTNYWLLDYRSGSQMWVVTTAKENGVRDSTAPVSAYYAGNVDLGSIANFTYQSSDNPNAYTSDDTYSYQYLGSDNIDPAAISYATSIEYQGAGNLTKLPYTISPSTSNQYSGTIEYNIEYQKNNGGWVSSTSWSSSTTGNRTNFEQGATYQFRVRARDGWGFTSTTYATGPVCTVTSKPVVSMTVTPAGSGTVTGAGEYSSGSSVTVKAIPANGWEFIGWTENGETVSTNATYTFTITESRSLTAVFKQKLTAWVGVSDKARKGVELYVGVNGKARKVTGAWIGVNGEARRFL